MANFKHYQGGFIINSEIYRVPPNYFSYWRSFAYLISAFVLAYFLWAPYFSSEPEDSLEYQVDTLLVVSESDLAFYDALEMTTPLERQIQAAFWGSKEDLYRSWIESYSDFYTWQRERGDNTLGTQLRLAILYAEQGEAAAATAEMAAIKSSDFANRIIINLFGYSYGFIDREPTVDEIKQLDTVLAEGWFKSHLIVRLAERRGNLDILSAEKERLKQRAETALSRTTHYLILSYSLVVIGLLLLVWFVGFKKGLPPPYLTQGQAAWSVREGVALWTRYEFLAALYFILVYEYLWWFPLASQWGSLLSALPGLWLIHRYLLLPQGLNFITAWGLSPAAFGWQRLVIWTLVIIAISSLGSFIIQLFLLNFDLDIPWTEGVSETLFWGSTTEKSLEIIDTVIWAPIVEEILFRGLVYVALRNVFKPLSAAFITGLLFASLHFYSFSGLVDLIWVSIVWALAYERCRSLLPIILAHSVGNINWAAFWLMMY